MNTGDEYFDSEEFREMLATYERAVNKGQPVLLDADELAEIADYYQMNEQPEKAEAAITLALRLAPGAIGPLTYRIHEALFNGDVERAKALQLQILEKDEPDYVYNQAEIMLAEGKVDEADAFLREEFKKVAPEEYQDFVVDVANIFAENGESEKAMEWMARAKHEDTSDFKELMARTLFGLGKYQDSAKLWTELIDRDPFQKRYWNALSSAQFMNQEYGDSIESSEYAIAIDPKDTEAIVAKANGLYRLGNFEEALKYYVRYGEMEPEDEFALLQQGICLINLERLDEAFDVLKEAENRAPAGSVLLPDIYQEQAFVWSERGDAAKAVECLDKTDSLECDHSHMEVIKGHVLLGTGDIDAATEHYHTALNESEDIAETLLRIIVSLYDNRYVESAYKMFKQYFSIAGTETSDGWAYLALCCFDLKKYDEFLKNLKTACERNPEECHSALAHLFPEEVKPEEYYNYIKDKLKK